MSVRMRHTSGHTKNRRSHHSLEAPRLSKCSKCGSLHLRHHVCKTCGEYRGRQVIDVQAQIAKQAERRKSKLKELGKDPNEAKGEKETPTLDAQKLSQKTK